MFGREFRFIRCAAGAVVVLSAATCSTPVFAYRPFDGTDAAVAEPGELEANCNRRAHTASRVRTR